MVQNAVQYAAKCNAFWCKMQCVLVQNAVRFDAKRKVKWCKTRGEKHKNTPQKYKYNLIEP